MRRRQEMVMSKNASLKLVAVPVVVGLVGCAVPAFFGGSTPETPQTIAIEPAPGGGGNQNSSSPKKAEGEKIHPQSFSYLGGSKTQPSLRDYDYFYVENHTGSNLPPFGSSPPRTVKGHRVVDGTVDDLDLIAVNAQDTWVAEGASTVSGLGSLALYKVQKYDSATGTSIDLCSGEAYACDSNHATCSTGELGTLSGKAIAARGYWNQTSGAYTGVVGQTPVFSLSCMTGAVAKCMHWGYVADKTVTITRNDRQVQEELAPYYQACVRAARAQYNTENSHSYTCEGTSVDFFDRLGIQPLETVGNTSNYEIEAAWTANGPYCISSTRYPLCNTQVTKTPCEAINWLNPSAWPDSVLLVTRKNSGAPPLTTCPINGQGCAQVQ
jgi:hypothetical protein